MSNDHSSTPLATADLKPVVVGSGVWFGVFWRIVRATDVPNAASQQRAD